MAPRKVRFVADLLRGRTVNDAEAELMLHPRRAAKPLLKLLRSAVANAKQQKMDQATLIVAEIRVDQGPMLKRFLPRARGMATPIQKKMSNITLILGEGAVKTPRFSIVTARKPKSPLPHAHGPKKGKEKPGAPAEGAAKAPRQQPGFLKRMFRRKSV